MLKVISHMTLGSDTRNWNQTSVPAGMPVGQVVPRERAPEPFVRNKNWPLKGDAKTVPLNAGNGTEVNESQAKLSTPGGAFVRSRPATDPPTREPFPVSETAP